MEWGRKMKGDFKFYWSEEGVGINSNCEITGKVRGRDL